jgi:hypothetical protein
MYVFVYVCVLCVYVSLCVHPFYEFVSLCIQVCMCVFVHVCVRVCACVYMYASGHILLTVRVISSFT